jgi:hypothetical protein
VKGTGVKGLDRTTFQTEILMMAHTEKGKLEHLQKYKEKGILEHIKIWIMSR